ncbi:retrovirus-related pol polyprotein from transposon TNT 1-94 [Tanacetum coccineum]
MVPRAVLMKSGLVSLNTARQVNTAHLKITMNSARPMTNVSKLAHSTVKWPIHNNTTFKNSNFNQRVNTIKDKKINTARPKEVVNAARPKAVVNVVKGNNVNAVKALAYYEEIDEGYVSFGGNPKGGKITGKGTIKTGNLDFENAEAVNTACFVQNRVLVTKPHNKTPYELFLGRKPALGFMRPFGCHVTILNTIDHLGKFDGKVDEGFFVGENTPNIAGSGPNWLFDIDALTKSMNYKPVVEGNQSNGNAGIKACDDAGKARMETIPSKEYILLPLWTVDPPFSQSSKSSPNGGFKPSGDDEKKVTKEPGKEGGNPSKEDERDDQEKDVSVNNTNNVNTASTNEVNAIGRKASIELPDDPYMPALEDIVYSDDDEDVGAEADMNNLDAFMPVSPIPTTRIYKDH